MRANVITARFCALQARVANRVPGVNFPSEACDCFCRNPEMGGLHWPLDDETYQNSGKALEWIERVVNAALDTHHPTGDNDANAEEGGETQP